ncbi:MAG: DUF1800 domain-containing protein [Saprospiraceae bacterium]|nr:DUF1800 domain-containing protein [Saprospiraceae bacterium]
MGTYLVHMPSLTPYSGPFGKKELLHLLRRTLFGVRISDLRQLNGKSLISVIDLLLKDPPPDAGPLKTYFTVSNNVKTDNLDTTVPMGTSWANIPIPIGANPNPNGYRRLSYKNWWTGLQIHQDISIYEKMVLFWHNHFATEDSVVEQALLSYYTNVALRKNTLGSFRQMVKDITLDPGMLRYLNGNLNKKSAPDENYGRELQELFCIGKGSGSGYTEDDVKAAARVLTGWTFITQKKDANNANYAILPETSFVSANHDVAAKQFSAFYKNKQILRTPKAGEERLMAELEIDDMISMLLETDECAKFICRKLWIYFVYYDITPDIESNVIEPLAEIFRKNYDIKEVLRALFTSDYFFKSENFGCMLKSPTDFTIGMLRTFQLPIPKPDDAVHSDLAYVNFSQIRNYVIKGGFDVGDPPNVAGWPAYYQAPVFHEYWLDTTTYPERKNFFEAVGKSGLNSGNSVFLDANKNQKLTIDYVSFVKQFAHPEDPNELINEAIELLFGVSISDAVKSQIKTTYLLLGQSSDYYWTDAYQIFIGDPSTSDPEAKRVPSMLQDLFIYLQSAAEYHLC